MLNTETTYLSQVRAALWGEPVEPASCNEELLLLHMRQGTGTMVFPRLPMMPQMKMVCLQNIQQQVKLHYILTQAWKALTKAGIQPVLMKGAGLAALYPEPQMRAWGDIDLFIGIEHYHPACAVMRDTFPDALKFDEELDHYKHYNLIADGISIEIHRVSIGFQHPIDARRYAKIEAFGMTNSQKLELEGLTVHVPDPTFNALFVMLHSWEHATTQGANLRQICDLALLLHRHAADINRSLLRSWLQQLHMLDAWQLYMYLLVNRMGLPQEEAPFYSERVAARAEHFLDDLLKGRLVAPKAGVPASKNRLARKFHTMQERIRNARRIASYSPEYARHMKAETFLHGALRLFAKDRHWE